MQVRSMNWMVPPHLSGSGPIKLSTDHPIFAGYGWLKNKSLYLVSEYLVNNIMGKGFAVIGLAQFSI